MAKRVLLGFSGGIDSCAAARILRDEGYKVTALTLDMTGDPAMLSAAGRQAAALQIAWRCADVRERFRSLIVEPFIDEYLRGRTPAPCTRCNPLIKWHALLDIADHDGFDHIATGHYFTIRSENGRYYVCRGADPIKDQSYYLWGLPQHILARTLTPLGDRIKATLRDSSTDRSTPSGESMGVCFLHGRPYGDFLHEQRPGYITPGEIVTHDGRLVGHHGGYPLYTIGQRRGTGLPRGMCITGCDPATNRLFAGPDSDLRHHHLIIGECAVVDLHELLHCRDLSVRIRGVGRNPEGYARAELLPVSCHATGLPAGPCTSQEAGLPTRYNQSSNPDAIQVPSRPGRISFTPLGVPFGLSYTSEVPGLRANTLASSVSTAPCDFATRCAFPLPDTSRSLSDSIPYPPIDPAQPSRSTRPAPRPAQESLPPGPPSCHQTDRSAPLRLLLSLAEPAWAPAAGQPVVIYRKDKVLGGGILEKYY